MANTKPNAYAAIIEAIFQARYKSGQREVPFDRSEITEFAEKLGLPRPANLGDVVYTFRFRQPLPKAIQGTARKGHNWIIRLAGHGRYKFGMIKDRPLLPNASVLARKIPNATPGLIAKYALSDEQALLAIVRYNRLIDIFTGIACYSLQSHLRTTVPGVGQIETDEVYVGIDKAGVQYVIPVQAKGGKDKLGIVQTEQDIAMCENKFPDATCVPISAQFMSNDIIALFHLVVDVDGIAILNERHYRLVTNDQITAADLTHYQNSD